MSNVSEVDFLKDAVARVVLGFRELDADQRVGWASLDAGKRYFEITKSAISLLPKVRDDVWPPLSGAIQSGVEPGCCALKYSDIAAYLEEILEILKNPNRPEYRG